MFVAACTATAAFQRSAAHTPVRLSSLAPVPRMALHTLFRCDIWHDWRDAQSVRRRVAERCKTAVSRGGAAPWEASMEGGATVMRWCRRSRSSMKRSGKLVRITSSNRRAWPPATPYLHTAGLATSELSTASLTAPSVRRESARRSTQHDSLNCRCLRSHARDHVSLPDRCAVCCNRQQDTGSRLLLAITFKMWGT